MQEIGRLAGYTTKNTQICLTDVCEIWGTEYGQNINLSDWPFRGRASD